ncbi:hypothetical protein E2C01_001763 [Portunus trituberculatus]|uniref:Uncharacterized protein n=1 Tax=Portunus trituberculatus TaxID=210409 RepID=A0A5B7CI52_PORTR|nr:hypothetical protein [Portunus trituberculatus]
MHAEAFQNEVLYTPSLLQLPHSAPALGGELRDSRVKVRGMVSKKSKVQNCVPHSNPGLSPAHKLEVHKESDHEK